MIIGEIIQNRKIEAVIPSYISGSGGSSRRDIENISGMAVIMCEGIVSDIVGTAEEIEIEEES